MAQGTGIRDRFANIASIGVTLSAANTRTVASLQTNMGFLGRRDQALAMAIDEIQYSPSLDALGEMTADGDAIEMVLATSDIPTDLQNLTDNRILDFHAWVKQHDGTAASAYTIQSPARKQFFPPLITAERTLFLIADTNGLGSAAVLRLRILFRVETLTGAELVELSEVFRLTG